ncbi:hypothetical protein [Pararhizobium sp.]|uniref:hypothetical protein n=1 Tax=Pararhizobium sp. TaxID=1977563 RepID=UPI0027261544|nr:hypothetical protein [Pararhizobium sp.]MDO9416022.1 hypothetical protein [Pararhizobium sp.]
MIHTRTLRLMMAGAAFLSLTGSAFALDGAAVVAKLNAAYAYSGASLTYDKVEVDGTTVKLTGTTIKAGPDANQSAKIGNVTLEGVEEDAEGGYYIETVSFPDINSVQPEASVTAKDLKIGGLSIPADASGKTIDDIVLYETASSGPITVTAKGKEVMSLTGVTANLTRQEGDAGFDFDANASGLKVNLTDVEDPKAKDTIQKLGLTELSGDINMKGSWELTSGKVNLEDYSFDFANIGKLALSLDISGYTMDFMKAIQEATKAAQANPDKEKANQAMGLAMMGLMQQLTFNGAQIRFEDASITARLLEYFAKEQGMTGEQLGQSIKGMAPIMIAQLNLPELQNQISAAINTYIDDPKSLTITAEPGNPVPFPMIMGAAMGAPMTIPQVLGVKVSAND